MTTAQHVRRIGLLIFAASALLGWLTTHTDVLFADGLRYIAQAKAIDRGSWTQGLVRSVDHPIYPMAIAAVHRLIGGNQPRDWQTAAQAAAAISGVLLVIPVYLVSLEVFGPSSAWLACFLIYLLPFNGHVLADTLSESTFLLFWTWGVWSALRFLRAGALLWVPLVIAFGVLAYLTRPEGLILPFALLAALILLSLFCRDEMPHCRLSLRERTSFRGAKGDNESPRALTPASRNFNLLLNHARRKWWCAIGMLVAGPILVAGPFMVMKGGISTKPSILRILGLGHASSAMAIERERPLDPDQTTARTIAQAGRAVIRAVYGATSLTLLLLAPLGIAASWESPMRRRYWLLLGTVVGLSTMAMVRLHAMSGYCTPRHAMVVTWILIPASAAGLNRLISALAQAWKKGTSDESVRRRVELAVRLMSLGCFLALWGPAAIASIDPGFHGYRQAGEWLARAALPGEGMLDPKGFALFYAGRPGYTFATLAAGVHDPGVRWVVAHEALVYGPWDYSKAIRTLVADRRPVRVFPEKPAHRVSKVYVYDLGQSKDRTIGAIDQPSQSRR